MIVLGATGFSMFASVFALGTAALSLAAASEHLSGGSESIESTQRAETAVLAKASTETTRGPVDPANVVAMEVDVASRATTQGNEAMPLPQRGAANTAELGQSIGTPRNGWLAQGERLEPGEGYFIRHPRRTWGTTNTVGIVQEVVATVRSQFNRIHRLSVGDLSAEGGGLLHGHFSHQSGRDVDLGLYFRKLPQDYPREFGRVTRDNIHYRASFTLLEALYDTAKRPDGVEWMMLDYGIQRMLYEWAQERGVATDKLDAMFQYPRGPTTQAGLIRHYPGHADHVHVRFKCPLDDPHCRV